MAFTFDPLFAADPSNAANVASNASIIIFDPADPGKAPITITDVTGAALPNPITVNKNGFGPAFTASIDRVAWSGGGFTGYFTSYEGMKQVAVEAAADAQAAAATAGTDAAAVATAAIGTATDASTAAAASAATAASNASASATAAANAAALVGAPADAAITAAINNGASATRAALNATIAQRETVSKIRYVDMFNGFFGGVANRWVTGQTNVATTLTGAVSAGSTVLPFASVSGVVAGMVYVVNAGTSNQQFLTVASIAANNVTMTGALTTALASGATITPLWNDTAHITATGYTALGHYLTHVTDTAGNLILANPGAKPITLLGNSWIAGGADQIAAEIVEAFPTATVVKKGIGGNTSAQLVARFDADVPSNSAYVIFNEPGVNDTNSLLNLSVMASNLEQLFYKCRAIGAVPIYLGPVPLTAYLTGSINNATNMAGLVGDGTTFPAVSSKGAAVAFQNAGLVGAPGNPNNTVVGNFALENISTGDNNTLIGYRAGGFLTTGAANTGLGRSALGAATTGVQSVAIGYNTLSALTTGTGGTAVGYNAGANVTGNRNTYIGYEAGRAPASVSANASTTGQNQTIVGGHSGQGSAAAKSNITTLGYGTTVTENGGVAIGTDSASTGASSTATDEMVLGTPLHTVRTKGTHRTDGGQRVKVSVPGAWPYTALASDYIIACTTTGGNRTLNLPAANATTAQGQVFIIKDTTGNAAVNNITITAAGADTIDGSATYVLNTNRGSVRIVSNSSNGWIVL